MDTMEGFVLVLLLLPTLSSCAADQRFAIVRDKPTFLENAVPCLDRSIRYRKRPTALVNVTSHLSIMSFHGLSAERMELAVDVFLWQKWTDHRCGFRPLPGQGSVLLLYSVSEESLNRTYYDSSKYT